MSYEEPWEQRPAELPQRGGGWRRTDLDEYLPALMGMEGWHLQAWKRSGGDPYFLYAPDGTLVARWEREPSLSDLYDCWHHWQSQKEERRSR